MRWAAWRHRFRFATTRKPMKPPWPRCAPTRRAKRWPVMTAPGLPIRGWRPLRWMPSTPSRPDPISCGECGAIRPAARRRARTSASSSRHCQIPIRRLFHRGASVQFDGQERQLRRIPDPACLPTLTLMLEEQCMTTREWETAKIRNDWAENPRWKGIKRGYSAEDVYRLRGSLQIEYTLARRGAEN